MTISYDASTLVPDLVPAVRMALGGLAQRRDQRAVTGMQDQLDTNSQAARAAQADIDRNTMAPAAQIAARERLEKLQAENDKILQRMARIDPRATQFAMGIARARDLTTLEAHGREAEEASRVYQGFIDTASKDPTEANKYLAGKIRELDEAGKDTSKLREMIGKKPDEQRLYARRMVILAGDAKLLTDNSMAAMKDRLDIVEKSQKINLAAAEEARKVAEVNTKATEKTAAIETANTAARDTASVVNTQIDDVLATLDNSSTGRTGGVVAYMNPQGTTAEKYRKLETLKSMIAIDKMIEMKKSSPTGSTGFGALSEKELAVIQNVIGNLDPSQSNEVLARELGKVRDFFSGISQRAGGPKLAGRAPPPAGQKVGRFNVTVEGMAP